MNVLLLPLLLASWAALSAWAAHRIGERLSDRGPGRAVMPGRAIEFKAVMFLVLLPLPLLDELLARPQFEALCREQAAVLPHPGLRPGRRVYPVDLPQEPVPGLALPILGQRRLYLDDETHAPLASVHMLAAAPGKLARLAGDGRGPLTFGATCGGAQLQAQLAALGLRVRSPADAVTGLHTSD